MANTSGSKIEATNNDFNNIMKILYDFLNDSNRKATSDDSNISKYTFSGDSSYPHTVSNGQAQEQKDNTITQDYSASLNLIYDILKNNYMKTGGNTVTIINNNQFLKQGNIIPALNQYETLVQYWKNGGVSACNGACVGYCSGTCGNGSTGGTCSGDCTNKCSGQAKESCGTAGCYSGCTSCTSHCGSYCFSGCSVGCYTGCSGQTNSINN